MKNKDLIQALVDLHFISSEEAEKVLRETESLGRSVEELLYTRNLVPETEVAKAKSRLLKVPFKKIDPESVSENIAKLIPLDTARSYQMVPLSRSVDLLVVGMVHPDNVAAQEALKFLAKQEKTSLGVYLVTPSDVAAVLKRFSPYASEIQGALAALKAMPGEGASSFQKIVKLEEGLTAGAGASEAPIIRIVASLFREAVNREASDIHIEPMRTKTRIRLRIDGDLHEFLALPPELGQLLVSRVKVLANMKLDETRIPQDGRFRTIIFEKEIDFRVAIFPTPNGEKVALRVLDSAVGLRSLEEIGVTGKNLDLLKFGIAKPFGMVLLTGPTGSGKTTTLYALMRILNREEVNILSLEDPVEYTIEGVNESRVKPEIGYDFATGLRQILRQDPDILMVGEIRDTETAGLAVNAALTGHIVLSTLHTNNAIGVIPRLIDMGVAKFLLPSALNLMAAQRLVSRLCDRCRKPIEPVAEVADAIRREIGRLPTGTAKELKEPYHVYQAPGCNVCRGKGVRGRIALFEVFVMTRELADIVVTSSFNESQLVAETKRQEMLTLRQDGILKALAGLVRIEEVFRETEEL